jgi:hypothetical protein
MYLWYVLCGKLVGSTMHVLFFDKSTLPFPNKNKNKNQHYDLTITLNIHVTNSTSVKENKFLWSKYATHY